MSVIQLHNASITSPDRIRARWPLPYHELLAASLYLYAEHDIYFRKKLGILAQNLPHPQLQNDTAKIPESAAIFLPLDHTYMEACWNIRPIN